MATRKAREVTAVFPFKVITIIAILLISTIGLAAIESEDNVIVTVRYSQEFDGFINILFPDREFERFFECLLQGNVSCEAQYNESIYPNHTVHSISLLPPPKESSPLYPCYTCRNEASRATFSCQPIWTNLSCSDRKKTPIGISNHSCVQLTWLFNNDGICFGERFNVKPCDNTYKCPALADSTRKPNTTTETMVSDKNAKNYLDADTDIPIEIIVGAVIGIVSIAAVIVVGTILCRRRRRRRQNANDYTDSTHKYFNKTAAPSVDSANTMSKPRPTSNDNLNASLENYTTIDTENNNNNSSKDASQSSQHSLAQINPSGMIIGIDAAKKATGRDNAKKMRARDSGYEYIEPVHTQEKNETRNELIVPNSTADYSRLHAEIRNVKNPYDTLLSSDDDQGLREKPSNDFTRDMQDAEVLTSSTEQAVDVTASLSDPEAYETNVSNTITSTRKELCTSGGVDVKPNTDKVLFRIKSETGGDEYTLVHVELPTSGLEHAAQDHLSKMSENSEDLSNTPTKTGPKEPQLRDNEVAALPLGDYETVDIENSSVSGTDTLQNQPESAQNGTSELRDDSIKADLHVVRSERKDGRDPGYESIEYEYNSNPTSNDCAESKSPHSRLHATPRDVKNPYDALLISMDGQGLTKVNPDPFPNEASVSTDSDSLQPQANFVNEKLLNASEECKIRDTGPKSANSKEQSTANKADSENGPRKILFRIKAEQGNDEDAIVLEDNGGVRSRHSYFELENVDDGDD